MSLTDAWPRFTCAQYDGTAASLTDVMDVANLVAWETWTMMSSTSAGVTIKESQYGSVLTVPMNGWVMRNGMDAIRIYSESEFPLTFSRRRAVVQESTDASYFGMGSGQYTSLISIGATATINVRVSPPVPSTKLDVVKLQTVVTTGSAAVTANPTIVTALVPASTANGVTIPEHTLVRTIVRNTGVSVLSSTTILTTAHV